MFKNIIISDVLHIERRARRIILDAQNVSSDTQGIYIMLKENFLQVNFNNNVFSYVSETAMNYVGKKQRKNETE